MFDSWLPILLLAQGVVGGVDTLLNHEWLARLPHRVASRNEIGLHAVRETIYASLFGGLAWFAWHGIAAWVIGALLLAEIIVTTCDEFIENRTRTLPQNERVLHVFLTLNLGFLIAILAPILWQWGSKPTRLVPIDHGMLSWGLSALAMAAAAWSMRDLLAFQKLGRLREQH